MATTDTITSQTTAFCPVRFSSYLLVIGAEDTNTDIQIILIAPVSVPKCTDYDVEQRSGRERLYMLPIVERR